jgi:hypothetical protein
MAYLPGRVRFPKYGRGDVQPQVARVCDNPFLMAAKVVFTVSLPACYLSSNKCIQRTMECFELS